MPGALNSAGDFTPFGYLANPAHVASSWREVSGGSLRTAPDRVGIEWAYPVGRAPTRRVGLGLETVVDGRPCRTRAELDAIGLTSRHHSCFIFGFDWQIDGVQVEARFFLASDNALCLRLTVSNHASGPRHAQIDMCAWLDDDGVPLSSSPTLDAADQPMLLTDVPSAHAIVCDGPGGGIDLGMAAGAVLRRLCVLARGPSPDAAIATGSAALSQAEARFEQLLAADARFYAQCPTLSGDWPAQWREGLFYDFETTRLLVQPAGGIFTDVWPSWMAAWPRVVLAEGTLDMQRLAYADPDLAQRCVLSMFRDAPQPNLPCVFRDGEYNMLAADGSRCGTSPAWCLPFLQLELLYLRTLDRDWLARVYPYACAFVDWWLEQRVDADGWVVYKCTWESGEDGNPRLDPSGSGDADISHRIRPVELQATIAHAAGVLANFAAELRLSQDILRWRAVETTYRDCTRQLFDPQEGRYRDWVVDTKEKRKAEHVVNAEKGRLAGAGKKRAGERSVNADRESIGERSVNAAVESSGGRVGAEEERRGEGIGGAEEERRDEGIGSAEEKRVGERSVNTAAESIGAEEEWRDDGIGGAEATEAAGVLYWGIDPHRFSVQSLTPLLIGLPIEEAEILRHACPPWTLWPSWTTTFVESAAAAGLYQVAGTLAFETIDRVYRVTTRRHLDKLARPMPGCAPEFWPTDWQTYDGNDAYGWGATTANLLIRHLFGFKESRLTDGWVGELAPALPDALLQPGRHYAIRRLNYRGLVFDLTYTVMPDRSLEAELDLGSQLRACEVSQVGGTTPQVYASTSVASRHRFPVQLCRAVQLRLR